MEKFVSVIIPTFNNGHLIKETIDSVLNQTHHFIEVIVVDDGSTDDTSHVVKKIMDKDKRVQYWKTENMGSPMARNFGISKALCEYISFVDGDDLWPEYKLELQLEALMNNEDAIVIGNVQRFHFDEFGNKLWGVTSYPPVYKNYSAYIDELFSLDDSQMVNFNTLLCKTLIVKTQGLWDPEIKTAHDWDNWIRLAHRHPFINIDRTLQFYRKHNLSTTKKQSLNRALVNQLKVIDKDWAYSKIRTFKWLEYRRIRLLKFVDLYLYEKSYKKGLKLFLRCFVSTDILLTTDFQLYCYRFFKKAICK